MKHARQNFVGRQPDEIDGVPPPTAFMCQWIIATQCQNKTFLLVQQKNPIGISRWEWKDLHQGHSGFTLQILCENPRHFYESTSLPPTSFNFVESKNWKPPDCKRICYPVFRLFTIISTTILNCPFVQPLTQEVWVPAQLCQLLGICVMPCRRGAVQLLDFTLHNQP